MPRGYGLLAPRGERLINSAEVYMGYLKYEPNLEKPTFFVLAEITANIAALEHFGTNFD